MSSAVSVSRPARTMSALTGASSLVELRSSMVSSGRSVAGGGTAGGAAVGGVFFPLHLSLWSLGSQRSASYQP